MRFFLFTVVKRCYSKIIASSIRRTHRQKLEDLLNLNTEYVSYWKEFDFINKGSAAKGPRFVTLPSVSLGSQSFSAYIHHQLKRVLHSYLLEDIFLKINTSMLCSGTAQTHCAVYLVFSFLNQQMLFNYCSVHNIARNQIPTGNSCSFVNSCCTVGKIRGAMLTKNETDYLQETNSDY